VDFTLSEAQEELAGLARKILAERDAPWADLAAAGVLAAGLPASLDGSGLGLLEQCSVLIELGRAASDVPYLASIVLGAGAVASFGTAEQRERWARPAGQGSVLLTAALAEEDGDDPSCPSARAERSPDGSWVLSGVKTAVDYAPRAGLFLVPCASAEGVRVFLVAPSDAGVSVEPQVLTSFAPAGRVALEGVVVGPDRVLGPGAEVADWLVARGMVGRCAMQAGVAGRALELTAEHARTRVQFGRPVGSFQAVAQRLADAFIDVEAVRLTMWQAAWLLSAGLPADVEVATAKFWAADAGHRVAHTAVHVHGGLGIDVSYPVHRYFAAAKGNEFALGGATAQLRRIGAALARGLPACSAERVPGALYRPGRGPRREQRGSLEQRVRAFGREAVEGPLQPSGDVRVAGRDDPRVIGRGGAVSGPVERGEELEGEVGRHRQRRRQDRRDAERETCQQREDVDPEGAQACGPGQAVAAGQHHDRVVAAVGDHGHDRDPAAQGESHEALPAGEIDLVPLGPRAAGLEVASRVHQDARPVRQRGLGLAGARGDDAEPAQERPDPRDGEQEIVGERVGWRVDATSCHDGLSAGPGLGYVEQAGMIADHECGALRGQPVQPSHLWREIARVPADGGQVPADEVRVARLGGVGEPGGDPLREQCERPRMGTPGRFRDRWRWLQGSGHASSGSHAARIPAGPGRAFGPRTAGLPDPPESPGVMAEWISWTVGCTRASRV
jgi:3-oxocholest-4-en-26-oyl-CoA dehydrogenase beta subunit